MPRLPLLLFLLTSTLTLTSAMGPHYLSNHDSVVAALDRRGASYSSSHHVEVGGGHGRRALGRKRHFKKRGTCKPSSSAGSSSSSSSSSGGSDTGSSNSGGDTGSGSGGNSSTVGGASSSTGSGSVASTLSALIASTGITAFITTNTGGIASWFNPDSAQDSTNGHSWCGFPYNNDTPGFAPDVSKMLANFGGDYTKAATAYCGLEAEVTANGVTKTLVIADGFDPKWVRTPASIDIIHGAFAQFFGSQTDNKNDVIQGVSWKLTGARNPRYAFKGQGN